MALIDGSDLLGVDAIDVISAKTFNVALVLAIVTSLSTRDSLLASDCYCGKTKNIMITFLLSETRTYN